MDNIIVDLVTLATMTFSGRLLLIDLAISKGVVWKLIPSFCAPFGKTILIGFLGNSKWI